MKLTQERLEELKETAEEGKTFLTFDPQVVLDLIADLENERARGIHSCNDNCTRNGCVNVRIRKELAEAVTLYNDTLRKLSAEYAESKRQWKLGYAEGNREVQHWRANHESVVKKLRLFTQREDLPVDRLPAYEYVLELEKKLAAAQAREALTRNTMNTVLGFPPGDSLALEAAIADAIADEARNPWKQAIINELVVSHILRTDHETDPVKALAALVDYECKVALDPAVSKEAQELIEPYRKDAACWQFARKELSWSRAWFEQIKWAMYIEMDAPNIAAGRVTDDSVARELDAAVLAAIAAKGESECPS